MRTESRAGSIFGTELSPEVRSSACGHPMCHRASHPQWSNAEMCQGGWTRKLSMQTFDGYIALSKLRWQLVGASLTNDYWPSAMIDIGQPLSQIVPVLIRDDNPRKSFVFHTQLLSSLSWPPPLPLQQLEVSPWDFGAGVQETLVQETTSSHAAWPKGEELSTPNLDDELCGC